MRTVFRGDVLVLIETGDFSGDTNRKPRRIEARNRPDSANALAGRVPERFPANAIRADRPDPGNYGALLHLYSRCLSRQYRNVSGEMVMAHVDALNEEKYVLRDVGGVVGHALKVVGDKDQIESG